MNKVVLLLAVVVMAIRCTVPPGLNPADTYKDLAHVFVGTTLGAWCVFWWLSGHDNSQIRTFTQDEFYDFGARYCGLFWILTGFEVFCAITGKVTGKPIVNLPW